jgi:hypothetical protein
MAASPLRLMEANCLRGVRLIWPLRVSITTSLSLSADPRAAPKSTTGTMAATRVALGKGSTCGEQDARMCGRGTLKGCFRERNSHPLG